MKLLGSSYVVVSHESYRMLGLSFICRSKVKDLLGIRDVSTDHLKDQSRKIKACAIGANIAKKKYAFVNSYINPTFAKEAKESDIQTPSILLIDSGLNLSTNPYEEEKLSVYPNERQTSLSKDFDVCVFLGGFNTPIVGSASGVNSLITSNMFEALK